MVVMFLPFLAQCKLCNHQLTTLKYSMLKQLMKDHDKTSHHSKDSETFDFCTWNITRITEQEYYGLVEARKRPAFWKTVYHPNPPLLV